MCGYVLKKFKFFINLNKKLYVMLYMIMYSIPMIGPKTAKFGQKLAILFLSGQIYAFLVHFGAMPDQKTIGTRRLFGF